MYFPPKTRRTTFTLIELLVVIAIIAVLASMLLPALNSARQRAKVTSCQGNMRQLMIATTFYADENDGALPLATGASTTSEELALAGNLADGRVWECPGLTNSIVHTMTLPNGTVVRGSRTYWPNAFRPADIPGTNTGGLGLIREYMGMLKTSNGPRLDRVWGETVAWSEWNVGSVHFGFAGTTQRGITLGQHNNRGANVTQVDGSVHFIGRDAWIYGDGQGYRYTTTLTAWVQVQPGNLGINWANSSGAGWRYFWDESAARKWGI